MNRPSFPPASPMPPLSPTVQSTAFAVTPCTSDDDGQRRSGGIQARADAAMARVLDYIQAHLSETMTLSTLAALARLSVSRFCAVFKASVGMTPHRYITQVRVAHAQQLLRDGHPLLQTALACGFYDQSHLSRCLKAACGMSAGQYRGASLKRVDPDDGEHPPSFLPLPSH